MQFCKIRFTNGPEHTAGIVLDADKVRSMTVCDASRYFPLYEVPKMRRYDTSPAFNTWDEAFHYNFEDAAK